MEKKIAFIAAIILIVFSTSCTKDNNIIPVTAPPSAMIGAKADLGVGD